MEILCDNCNVLFNKPISEIGRHHNFCCRLCWKIYTIDSKNKIVCDNCGLLFYKSKQHGARQNNNFCCKKCWLAHDGSHNKNFFSIIDTEEKVYWLGFICADGWLDERDKAVGIQLHNKDREHLIKFAGLFRVGVRDYRNRNCVCSRCMVYSKQLYYDLIAKGVKPRKSLADNVEVFNFVPNDLMNHFIRGWFDGDGSFACNILKKTYIFSITGTFKILSKIFEIIKINTSILTKAKLYKYLHKNRIYDIRLGGKNQALKIKKWLYDKSTVYLTRKRNKFEEIV